MTSRHRRGTKSFTGITTAVLHAADALRQFNIVLQRVSEVAALIPNPSPTPTGFLFVPSATSMRRARFKQRLFATAGRFVDSVRSPATKSPTTTESPAPGGYPITWVSDDGSTALLLYLG